MQLISFGVPVNHDDGEKCQHAFHVVIAGITGIFCICCIFVVQHAFHLDAVSPILG